MLAMPAMADVILGMVPNRAAVSGEVPGAKGSPGMGGAGTSRGAAPRPKVGFGVGVRLIRGPRGHTWLAASRRSVVAGMSHFALAMAAKNDPSTVGSPANPRRDHEHGRFGSTRSFTGEQGHRV